MEQNMNSLYTESTKTIIYMGYEDDEDTILWRNDLILDNFFFVSHFKKFRGSDLIFFVRV